MDIPSKRRMAAQVVIRCDQSLVDRAEVLRAGYEGKAGLPVRSSEVLRAALEAGISALERKLAKRA